MTKNDAVKNIIDYFEDHSDLFNEAIEELDNYNGYLSDDRRHVEQFNPNADYFYFNGSGNLVSTNYVDYSDYLDRWAVEAMAENRQDISTIESDPDLWDLFDAYEEADEDDSK